MTKYFFFSVVWIALWGCIVYKVVSSSLPYNPLSPDYVQKAEITGFIPEGWGFFTRNPREEKLYLFEFRNDHWIKNPYSPIANFSNEMGINRFPRAQSVELALLLSQLKLTEKDWKPAMINISHVNVPDTGAIVFNNPSPYPTLKNKICIVRQAPVPWAWSWNREALAMPSQYIIVNVQNK